MEVVVELVGAIPVAMIKPLIPRVVLVVGVAEVLGNCVELVLVNLVEESGTNVGGFVLTLGVVNLVVVGVPVVVVVTEIMGSVASLVGSN